MILCDTHTHLYLDAFDNDRKQVVADAVAGGVKYMVLPNIDSSTVKGMMDLCSAFPGNCFPMMGLHPGSVKENYVEELDIVESWLDKGGFYGIGETGIDLYWDTTFRKEQEESFRRHAHWAHSAGLPLIIHSRNSIGLILDILDELKLPGLKGIFHCFGGTPDDARRIIDLGFYLGIGGVVTYKKSDLPAVLANLRPENILLETDSPFLPPVPFRGKRNESGYLPVVGAKLAEIYDMEFVEIAEITTTSAVKLFGIIDKE